MRKKEGNMKGKRREEGGGTQGDTEAKAEFNPC
jgi:hypothetical protein